MTQSTRPVSARWKDAYPRRLAIVDLVVLTLGVALSWVTGFHAGTEDQLGRSFCIAGLTVLVWWLLLGSYRTRDADAGIRWGHEAKLLFRSGLATFGVLAMGAILVDTPPSRGALVGSFAITYAVLLAARAACRSRIAARRRRGELQSLVLVLGTVRSSRRIARWFYTDPACPYRVTGVRAVDQAEDEETLLWRTPEDRWPPIPLLGSLRSLDDALEASGADTVIVSDSEQLGPDGLNDLVWELDRRGISLMVSPNVVGVSQPRLELRDVAGVPFVFVDKPRYAGAGQWTKTLFDYTIAGLLTLLVSPVLLASALAIKLGDRGPVFDRVTRVGRGGRTFTMLRLRTLPVGVRVPERTDVDGPRLIDGDGVELTKVGRVLRRYSIDELPQLLNVLRGDMSLVGPRPLDPTHLSGNEERVARRLLVKQGITGVWQISGRSNMTWDEATRLELEYVENWSVSRDLGVIWRSAKAVRTRARLARDVAALQARIDQEAPSSKAQLRVDSRGQIFLNEHSLFGGDTTTLLAEIDGLLAKREPALLVTVNVDQILDWEREQRTQEVYDGADLLVMDGMPVVQLAKMLGADEAHRHTGADLLPMMAAESALRGWRVSILGGATGVAEAAADQLREAYPGAEVSSVEFPMMRDVADAASHGVIGNLKAQRPDLVFVCLGAPKQELWVLQWRDELPPAVYVGAGAAVDFAAQKVSRAPQWVQKVGGEWLWRLGQEPGRLAGRYLLKGPRFIMVIARSLKDRR